VDLIEGRSDGLELSLKLYHAGELQLGYQQLMAEAPGVEISEVGGLYHRYKRQNS
jgi:hypothetical protein